MNTLVSTIVVSSIIVLGGCQKTNRAANTKSSPEVLVNQTQDHEVEATLEENVLVLNINGEEQKCKVTVKGPKDIKISDVEEKAKSFLNENLSSIAMHRGPRSFEESDGKYKLIFGDDGSHPLGRKLVMGGDGMSSFYRIKDGRIQQINRQTPRFSFSINIEESKKNQDGKFLTRKYSVFYFNPETKGLKDVESYTDEYTRVGEADLPKMRRIINCEEGAISVSTMTLSNHELI